MVEKGRGLLDTLGKWLFPPRPAIAEGPSENPFEEIRDLTKQIIGTHSSHDAVLLSRRMRDVAEQIRDEARAGTLGRHVKSPLVQR